MYILSHFVNFVKCFLKCYPLCLVQFQIEPIIFGVVSNNKICIAVMMINVIHPPLQTEYRLFMRQCLYVDDMMIGLKEVCNVVCHRNMPSSFHVPRTNQQKIA